MPTHKFSYQDVILNVCTHEQYCSQFVTSATKDRVVSALGLEKLLNSTDPYFNDIPLALWDRLGDPHNLGHSVSVLKCAARMVVDEHNS